MSCNILVACEESQRVTKECRKLGFNAFSCDIQETSGEHPEWHIKANVLDLLNGKCMFRTCDGEEHTILNRWDMIIAFPPCTYITNVATRHHSLKCTDLQKINDRTMLRVEAIRFFMNIVNAECDRIAIENPVGIMSTVYRKPDQIIHPYMFASSINDSENYVTKATCLWLKGLNPLKGNELPKPDNRNLFGVTPSGRAYTWVEKSTRDSKTRSKTFPGVAKAMAEQWCKFM